MKSKHAILEAATHLFAQKGYDGTTTIDIAKEASINEPLIFYHYGTKAGLYLRIIESTFDAYFSRLEELEQTEGSALDKIRHLIRLHLDIADEMPDAVRLILSSMPAKLRDPEGICAEKYRKAGDAIRGFFLKSIESGVDSGQFQKVDAKPSAYVFSALVSGLLRQRVHGHVNDRGVGKTAIDFCKKILEKR